MKILKKILPYTLLVILLSLMLPLAASDFLQDKSNAAPASPFSDDRIAGAVSELGSAAQSNTINNTASGLAARQAASTIEEWLNYWGSAQVSLQMDSDFSLKDSSADLLIPLFSGERDIIFTQWGLRDSDGHITSNVGLGYRRLYDAWLLGANLFWDATWNNVNHRYGMGIEAWRDFLRLSANGYRGISGWHPSRQHEDYDERPADGWDARIEGWLPRYPHLGGKLMFEQYFGNEVGLLDWNKRQKDPYTFTIGTSYTPVPLLTTGVEMKQGKSGKNTAQLSISMNYMLGTPWRKQISPDEVQSMRRLSGSRLDFVSRNNNVVLDYRKQTLITLGFPEQVSGAELSEYAFTPAIKTRYGLSHITLDDTALISAGGKVLSVSANTVRLQMPVYRETPVRLSGVAYDRKGNRSNIAETLIYPISSRHHLTLKADKTAVFADGTDAATLVLNVTDTAGNAVPGAAVTLSTDGGQLSVTQGTTDAQGSLTFTLMSLSAGEFHVTAVEGDQSVTHEGISFETSLHGRLLNDRKTALANGTDAVTSTITLNDAAGRPVAGQQVEWKTTRGTLSSSGGKTDINGQLSVTLVSIEPGSAVITSSSGELKLSADPVLFTEMAPTITIEVDKTQADADGVDAISYTITMRSAEGQVIAGVPVDWNTDLGVLSASSTVTDSNGKAEVALSSLTAGEAHVQGTVNAAVLTAPSVMFESVFKAKLSQDKTTAIADGTTAVTYSVEIRDAADNPVAGQSISWLTDFGTLSEASSLTDYRGIATVKLTSDSVGDAIVSASYSKGSLIAETVSFTTSASSISLEADSYAVDTGQLVNLKVTVSDHKGKPVTGEWVSIATSLGTLIPVRGVTDSNGQLSFTLTSSVAGTANVTATTGNISATEVLVFGLSTLNLSVSAQDSTGGNANKVIFGTRSPTYAWAGAKLKLTVTGASGEVVWSSSSTAVTVNNDVATINDKALGVKLTGTDKAGHTVTYNLNTSGWIKYLPSSTDFLTNAQAACAAYSATVASKLTLQAIYNEWGNMMVYEGWLRNYYITSTLVSTVNGAPTYKDYWAFWAETELWVTNGFTQTGYVCY